MEMKFNETVFPCLHRIVDQQQIREQTQEVRLPDTMPDIGRVLGCWGQPIIRGKEWRSGSMGITGGVLGWVLYVPEDGSEVRSMEVWIPFQMKWDIPQTKRDGSIWVWPCLKSMDARATSARKLMVRTNVSVWGRALDSCESVVYVPDEVPEDVQLLRCSYPMLLPQESGEKTIALEEELMVPNTYPAVEKLLRYELDICIQEQKVMASRLVFRGKGNLHILYASAEKLYSWDCEIPFSQFVELDREYGPNAAAQILPVLTDLELQNTEGKLLFKADAAAQYVIQDRVMVQTVEDAYSPVRSVELREETMQMPMELDRQIQELRAEQKVQVGASEMVDICWMPEHPQRQQNGDLAEMTVPGQFQVLYYDGEGALQCEQVRWEQQVQIRSDSETEVDTQITPDGAPQAVIHGDAVEVSAAFQLEMAVNANGEQRMLSGLEWGEVRQLDPDRPSLILKKCDGDGLWKIAKSCGSTVEAIRRANSLDNEPQPGRMLLIPVY